MPFPWILWELYCCESRWRSPRHSQKVGISIPSTLQLQRLPSIQSIWEFPPCLAILLVTFLSPNVGGHDSPFKGSLNHPKKGTKNYQAWKFFEDFRTLIHPNPRRMGSQDAGCQWVDRMDRPFISAIFMAM